MKFLREAQKRVAKAALKQKLKSQGAPLPSEAELDRQAEQILDEADRLLKREGKRLLDGVKAGVRQVLDKRGGKG